jgi:hypothetical protein
VLPFQPADTLATETIGPVFSAFNDVTPFGPEDLVGTEFASNVFSVDNDPNAPIAAFVTPEGSQLAKFAPNTEDSPLSPPSETSSGVGGLSGAGGASSVEGTGGAQGSSGIAEPEPPSPPTLSVADVTVSETDDTVRFVVELSAPSDEVVSVDFESLRGEATPESEYEPRRGTLTFEPGAQTQTVAVTLYDDTLFENEEVFALSLTNAMGAALLKSEALAAIADDDPPPAARPRLFDDFETPELDEARWSATAEGELRSNDGLVSLAGSGVESRHAFALDGDGVAARARVRLSAAGQRFGFNAQGDDPSATTAYVFETVSDGDLDFTLRAVILTLDDTGETQTLLDAEVPVTPGRFADLVVERRVGEVVFLVDAFEVARGAHTTPEPLSVGFADDSAALLDADWIEVVPIVPGNVACLEPHSDLIAWWPGDGTTRDLASNRLATLDGGAGFAPGKVGQAFDLDGADDVIWVPESHGLAPADLTLAAWVLARSFGSSDWLSTVIARQASGEATTGNATNENSAGVPSYALQIDSAGHPTFSLWNGTSETRLASNTPLSAGTWHHVAAARDGARVSLYIDGSEAVIGTLDGDVVYNSKPGFDVEIGSYLRNGPSRALDGLVDEVLILERALGASEIQAIHQSGSAGYCVP